MISQLGGSKWNFMILWKRWTLIENEASFARSLCHSWATCLKRHETFRCVTSFSAVFKFWLTFHQRCKHCFFKIRHGFGNSFEPRSKLFTQCILRYITCALFIVKFTSITYENIKYFNLSMIVYKQYKNNVLFLHDICIPTMTKQGASCCLNWDVCLACWYS